MAFGTALTGFLLATAFYGVQSVDPADVRRAFPGLYRFLWNKWWFDEAYRFLFIRPALTISNWIAAADRSGIDRAVDGLARAARGVSIADDWFDRTFVDGLVNRTADWVYAVGLWMRTLQTGRLRQYVLFVAVGTVALFVIASLYWNYLFASLAPPLMH
jgi:NADH-quinone oxidoreductase subunit L